MIVRPDVGQLLPSPVSAHASYPSSSTGVRHHFQRERYNVAEPTVCDGFDLERTVRQYAHLIAGGRNIHFGKYFSVATFHPLPPIGPDTAFSAASRTRVNDELVEYFAEAVR